MRIDLHEIINLPGASLSFDYEPDVSGLDFPALRAILTPVRAVGRVRNDFGAFRVEADISGELLCSCDRCAAEFTRAIDIPVEAVAAEELCDEENSDVYLLDGDALELDEIIITAYVLEMDTKFLCRPDCKGLCPVCGKNLNEGACSCGRETDPRLAVLEQLLMDK